MSAEYTKQPYTPLVPVMAQPVHEVVMSQPAVMEEKGAVVMTRNPQHEQALKKTGGYVCLLIFLQMMVMIISLFGGNLLGFCITMVFVFLGLHGVKRQRRGMVIAHFVYSLLTLFVMIASFVGLIVYCADCLVITIALGIMILIKTLLLRQERIHIQLLGQSPDLPICVLKKETPKACEEEQAIPMQQFSSAVPVDLQQQLHLQQQQQPMMMPYFVGGEGGQQPVMYMPMMGATGQPQWIPMAQPGFMAPGFYPGFDVQQQPVAVESEKAQQ